MLVDVFAFHFLRRFKTHNLLAQVSNGGDDVGQQQPEQSGSECTKSNPHPQHWLSWYSYMGL